MRRTILIAALALTLAAFFILTRTSQTPVHHPAAQVPAEVIPESPSRKFLLVLDPGHTPEEPGALSARGEDERNFNQRLTHDLEQALAGDTAIQFLVTNRPDQSVPLADRAELANQRHANLFISIHHDSVQASLLRTWKYQRRKLKYCDRFSGYALFISDKPETYDRSLRFARLLGKHLNRSGFSPTLHHEDPETNRGYQLLDPSFGIYLAPDLLVLHQTACPAVLVEYGMIINRRDEKGLLDPRVRLKLASATRDAIQDFIGSASE